MQSTPSTTPIWVIHGPNLNMLGTREPEVYGRTTLPELDAALLAHAKGRGALLECFQSNHEGAIVDRIQAARGAGVGFIVINPAAFTHTSVAIRDALSAVAIPFIEVHVSNVHRREAFRHHSYVSDIATGSVVGLGLAGYRLALDYAIDYLAGTSWPAGAA